MVNQSSATTPEGSRDCDGSIPGYYNSPWPGEDGGPRRQMVPRSESLRLKPGERLDAISRPAFMANMVVLRSPGEVYLQGGGPPGGQSVSWVERIDPVTLEPLARSADLVGGPWWPGGILAHENGDLYVTHGRWCHRLAPDLSVVTRRQLPMSHPYNSLLALSDGNLVMKNFVRDGSSRSYLSILQPERLDIVASSAEVPEGSIARISSDRGARSEFVYVCGDRSIFRFRYENERLTMDENWRYRYRTLPPKEQSYAWDPVIAAGYVWFMDNGESVFQRTLRGAGVASGPVHLHQVSVTDAAGHDMLIPFGASHGTIVNPPVIDPSRKIVIPFDSGNGRIAAFRFQGLGAYTPLWKRDLGTSNHFILYAESGELVVNDFDGDTEHVVVLDIETGSELGRVRTPSALQSLVFQSPGWNRDLYVCTFTTLTRAFVSSGT